MSNTLESRIQKRLSDLTGVDLDPEEPCTVSVKAVAEILRSEVEDATSTLRADLATSRGISRDMIEAAGKAGR